MRPSGRATDSPYLCISLFWQCLSILAQALLVPCGGLSQGISGSTYTSNHLSASEAPSSKWLLLLPPCKDGSVSKNLQLISHAYDKVCKFYIHGKQQLNSSVLASQWAILTEAKEMVNVNHLFWVSDTTRLKKPILISSVGISDPNTGFSSHTVDCCSSRGMMRTQPHIGSHVAQKSSDDSCSGVTFLTH